MVNFTIFGEFHQNRRNGKVGQEVHNLGQEVHNVNIYQLIFVYFEKYTRKTQFNIMICISPKFISNFKHFYILPVPIGSKINQKKEN